MEQEDTQRNNLPGAVIAWIAVGLSCAYFTWSYHTLSVYTRVFTTLFISMGVEVPSLTRFVIASYPWFYPVLFFGAAGLMVTKEFIVRDKRVAILLTFVIALTVLFAVDGIKHLFTLPLLDVMQRVR